MLTPSKSRWIFWVSSTACWQSGHTKLNFPQVQVSATTCGKGIWRMSVVQPQAEAQRPIPVKLGNSSWHFGDILSFRPLGQLNCLPELAISMETRDFKALILADLFHFFKNFWLFPKNPIQSSMIICSPVSNFHLVGLPCSPKWVTSTPEGVWAIRCGYGKNILELLFVFSLNMKITRKPRFHNTQNIK